jgi:hypothetical protein
MMKNLLEKDFISHYKLSASPVVNVVPTNDTEFDLKDDAVLVYPSGAGIAKYSNPNNKEVNVINYESFFKLLPQPFQDNKNNCDLIVSTSDNQYFLLNELTDKGKKKGKKRTHAILQMLQTLQLICEVASIKSFIQNHSVKKCCYFNKKAQRPSATINATDSFNRFNTTLPVHGSQMTDTEIEKFGFELWEFSGSQTYLLE